MDTWVNLTSGVPIAADFSSTRGRGTPICVNTAADQPYYLKAGVVTAFASGSGVSDGDKGDITVSAAGTVWTIDNSVVTLAKLADMATSSLYYRKTIGVGAPEVNTLATLKTDLLLTGTNSGDQTITLTSDVTGSGTGSFATTIAAGVVTFAKMQNINTTRLLGRATAAVGVIEEIILGTNLSFTGTTLNAASGGVSDGDKGDITVSGGGTTWTIDAGVVTLAKMADVAGSSVFYRRTGGPGVPEVQSLATLKTDLNLTGTNSGDQTSIVGITGTLAQFNTAITDADITPTSRLINTTAPITGGGDLSADRTIAISAATTGAAGSMSAADKTKLDGFLTPVHMTADAVARGPTIADYFATTISLEASSTYIIECHVSFLKTTAGTIVWTWTCSSAPVMITSRNESTPITGYTGATITGAPLPAQATSKAVAATAHAASGSLTTAVDHSFVFWVHIRTNLATTIQLRSTESAGTITPRAGSFMKAEKIV